MAPRRAISRSKLIEIGEREGWICGICRDPTLRITRPPGVARAPIVFRLIPDGEAVQPTELDLDDPGYDLLAASVDHIVPLSAGGSDTLENLQIAHRFCNFSKHNRASPPPAFAAAWLHYLVEGTPVPARLWQEHRQPRRGTLGWGTRYLRLARACERGQVAIERRRPMLRYRVWRAQRRWSRRISRLTDSQ
jgi:hypothetical protein